MLLILGLSAVCSSARAELYQTIGVNVMSREHFRIGRIQYPISEMTAVVAREADGTARIQVKLFLPLGFKKEIIEDIKERCRKAGAKTFFIVYKS